MFNIHLQTPLVLSLLLSLSLTALVSPAARATELAPTATKPSADDLTGFSPELQATLKGLESWTLMVYDLRSGQTHGLNAKDWDLASIPASTFKVPHSLIGLATEVISPRSVFVWDGQINEISGWNQDHQLASAMRASCVPCFQQLARKIGVARMQSQLQALQFGQMDVRPETLDSFWLTGNSRISPRQQVDFMRRLASRTLPVAKDVQEQVIATIQDPEIPGLYGKTGWGRAPHQGFGDSSPEQRHYGWYVGFYQHQQRQLAFAVRLIGKTPLPDGFVAARQGLIVEYLKRSAQP